MTDSQNASLELSAEETAYFESGGEQELPAAPEVQQEQSDAPAEGQQPEQVAEQPQDGTRDDKGRFVRLHALHAEREEHKKTKSELEQIRQQQAILNDRWNTLLQINQAKENPEVQAPPDPETDIFAYAKWQGEQLKALQEKTENSERQIQEQRQIEEQERGIWNDWQQSATSYATERPEFGDAVKWLSDLRTKQLSAMSVLDERFASADGINAQINAELRAIVVGARQKGINPAEVVHNMAAQYGFQATQQAVTTPKMPEKLAGIATAQEQAKTLGQVPGRSGGDQLTAESIAAMSPKEFESWISDSKNARLFDKMMGA